MKTARLGFAVVVLVGLVGACGSGGPNKIPFTPIDHDPIFRLPPVDPVNDPPPPTVIPPGPTIDLLDLTTFERAIGAVGQADFLGQVENRGGVPAANSLYGGGAAAESASHLWVADQFNNRILRYPLPLAGVGPDADIVLGQLSMTTATPGLSEGDFRWPSDVEVDGPRLLICDQGNHRVVIYSELPTQTGAAGHVVVGQPDFYSSATSTSPAGMSSPSSVCVCGGKLIVADSGNHRVLIWHRVPEAHGVAADLVLGQADFSTTTPALTASGMRWPTGVWSDGTKLLVCDSEHHRILIWSRFPTVNGQAANLVLGQPDFTSTTTNQASGVGWPYAVAHPDVLWHPYDVTSNGIQIVVSDSNMRRVLLWNTWPSANHRQPEVVLGQSDMFHGWPNDDNQDSMQDATPSDRTVSVPTALRIEGKRLYVADPGNHRLLVFE